MSTEHPLAVHEAPMTALNLTGALVLISCVKSKLSHAAPARQLYTSAWFVKARELVESRRARWFILSALYGLVEPDAEISPYEQTLNDCPILERRAWAVRVLERLIPTAANTDRIIFFAGQRYREFLVGPLQDRGLTVEVPMAHLRIGKQLAWLSAHR